MRRTLSRLLALLLLIALLPRRADAQEPSARVDAESRAYENTLLAELGKLEPDDRDIWRQAFQEREAGDFEAAASTYSVVIEDHPSFDHALRRRCGARMMLGQLSLAREDCEAAYELNRRPENALALAHVYAEKSAFRDSKRAAELARSVLRDSSELLNALGVCEVGLTIEDPELLGAGVKRMRELQPDAWETHLYSSFHHAMLGEERKAKRALEHAHAAGLDDAIYEQVLAAYEGSESPEWYWAKRVGVGLLVWIGLAGVLIGAGRVLSRMTLSEAEAALSNPAVSARASDSRLHRAYATVLWLCCAYYYLSVPLVLLLVVALGGGIVLALLWIGRIPIKALVLVIVVVFGTLGAVLKSFFTRARDEPPGELLDLREAPKLRALLEEVAREVGTRPVDHVYLTPGADLAVFERGGMLAKLRGKGERCLLLGVAVLDGLDTRALQAILAHEYGHFSNEDTAGGSFALGVRRSIMHSAIGLAEVGVADWYNPAWLFLRGFHDVFQRISQGASRLQEVLADRWSARIYGGAAFERGLRHAIAADMRFDIHVHATINEVLEARHGLPNLYHYEPSKLPDKAGDIDALVEEAVNAEPSPYDSHPRPADRFRWVRALSEAGADAKPDTHEPAWSLFASRTEIEERMTAVVRARVAEQTGMVIPVEESGRVRRQKVLS